MIFSAMPHYTRAPQSVENAIIEGDTETVNQALPGLTGSELDRRGFPLLFLAVQQDQPEIFALLLSSGKFLPQDSGPNPRQAEELATLQSLGCTPDDSLEYRWGWGVQPERKRLSLFNKLLDSLTQSDPKAADTQSRREMLKALVQNPTAALYIYSKDMDTLIREEISTEALLNPSAQLHGCCLAELISATAKLRKQFDKATTPEALELTETRLHSLIAQADKDTLKEAISTAIEHDYADALSKLLAAHKEKFQPDDFEAFWWKVVWHKSFVNVPSILMQYYAPDPETLMQTVVSSDWRLCTNADQFRHLLELFPPENLSLPILHHILHKSMEPRIKDEGPYYHHDLTNKVWPYIDINTVTARPGEPGAKHLLPDALSGFGNDHCSADGFLIQKILSDPRLNLPSDILTEACLGSFEYVFATGRYDLFQDYTVKITSQKNFDPNGHACPLLIDLFRRSLNWRSDLDSLPDLSETFPVLKNLIDHPDFNPHETLPEGEKLREYLQAVKTNEDGRNKDAPAINRFIDRINKALDERITRLAWYLEHAFQPGIPPEKLRDKAGTPATAVIYALRAGRLQELLKAGARAGSLAEINEYQNTLESLLPALPEKYHDQINACLEECTGARIVLTRNLANKNSFAKRYLQQPARPERDRKI